MPNHQSVLAIDERKKIIRSGELKKVLGVTFGVLFVKGGGDRHIGSEGEPIEHKII